MTTRQEILFEAVLNELGTSNNAVFTQYDRIMTSQDFGEKSHLMPDVVRLNVHCLYSQQDDQFYGLEFVFSEDSLCFVHMITGTLRLPITGFISPGRENRGEILERVERRVVQKVRPIIDSLDVPGDLIMRAAADIAKKISDQSHMEVPC